MSNPFDISPADLATPAQLGTPFSAPIMQSHEVFTSAKPRGDISGRVDRRGPAPQKTPNEQYDAINASAQPRGSIDRPHRSREFANAQIARQAAQVGAGQALDVGALQSQVAAQAAVIAELKASNAALAARLDAVEGGGTGEAA